MLYTLIFTLNLLGLLLYLRIAERYAILDTPSARSSHREPTVRGGGLFLAPTFVALLLCRYPEYSWSALALILAAAVSYWDDVRRLPIWIRLFVYGSSAALLIVDLQPDWSLAWILLTLFLLTAWLNIFNFMDGINGMTVTYATVLIGSIWLSGRWGHPPPIRLGLELLPAILAFAWLNFRKKALCFAGDVGSVSLAMIIAWLFLWGWSGMDSIYQLVFPALYVVDSLLTMLRRLLRGENILQPHRRHLYQLLANERDWDQRLVALIYGGSQLLINALFIFAVRTRPPVIQFVLVLSTYLLLSLAHQRLQRATAPNRSIPVR